MAEDKSRSGPADDQRINFTRTTKVRYWTKKFGCTSVELKAAVRAVGTMAKDVEACLKGKGK